MLTEKDQKKKSEFPQFGTTMGKRGIKTKWENWFTEKPSTNTVQVIATTAYLHCSIIPKILFQLKMFSRRAVQLVKTVAQRQVGK